MCERKQGLATWKQGPATCKQCLAMWKKALHAHEA